MEPWRDVLTVVFGICQVVAVMLAVSLLLPLVIGEAILACVAAGWLPSGAAAVAYTLPLLSLVVMILCPFSWILLDKTRFAQWRPYRVLVGDAVERAERAMARLGLDFPGEDWGGRGQADR